MATPYRGYTEIPGAADPDVPYRVNLALREIDADMNDVEAMAELAKNAMPGTRGPILVDTDADIMRGADWVGDWAIFHSNVLNGPPIESGLNPLWLVKIRMGNTNAVEQIWESAGGTEHWVRISPTTTEWGPYRIPHWSKGKAELERYATLDDIPEGYHQIWASADATAYKLPLPGVQELHVYKYGSVTHIFSTGYSAGRMRMFATSKGEGADPVWAEIGADADTLPPEPLRTAPASGYKSVAVPFSLGQGVNTTTGQGYARVLQRMPGAATRVRVRISNKNPRFDSPDSDPMTLTNVSIGSRLTGAENSTAWVTIDPAATTGADGYVSPWITAPAGMVGLDVFIGYGWECAGTVQQTLATAYTGDTAAAALTGTGATRGAMAPGFVSLEVEVPASTAVVAVMGDSIASGVGSTAPVYYSWLDQWALGKNVVPTHWSHSGDTALSWLDPHSPKWELFGRDIAAADAGLYALGSNDIFGATPVTLEQLQERTRAVVGTMRRMVSPNVYGVTVTPRDGVTGAKEDLRRAYNAWLPESGLFRDVFDVVPAVSADDENLDPALTVDGIHFNATGYDAMADRIIRPIVTTTP